MIIFQMKNCSTTHISGFGIFGLPIAILAMVFVNLNAAYGQDVHHQTQFSVKFGGITVGTVKFDVLLNGANYQMIGSGKTAGLAKLFSSGHGSFDSKGNIKKNTVFASTHTAFLHERKKDATLEMTFADKKVADIKMVPDKRPGYRKSKKWVPINSGHMLDVIDPASSLLIPIAYEDASDPHKVCDRNLEIFDGQARYTLTLRYKATKPIKTEGYKGYAHVCKVRYSPVAGYKKGHKNVEFMRKNKRMDFWLAPISGTNIFTPIRIDIGTQFGKVSVVPKYFGLTATQ